MLLPRYGLLLALLPLSCLAAFTGTNLSGDYACTGHNAAEGTYQATLTLNLSQDLSSGGYGSYALQLKVGDRVYTGDAVAEGGHIATTIQNYKTKKENDPPSDNKGRNYSYLWSGSERTGLGTVTHDGAGHIHIHNFYFVPEIRASGNGTEDCTR